MPKSKRDKKVSLTRTRKKGLDLKQRLIDDVKNCVEKFNSVFIATHENIRTSIMQDIRLQWKPSRFVFGKKKVIALGLGTTPEDEVQDDLHKLSNCLKGECALFFTDSPKEEVIDWFNNFSAESFARSGFKATHTVKLEEGPLKQFAHSIEPYLRKCGLPTKLEKGIVTLLKDYEVCKEGSPLTPEQAKILEFLDIKMATFKIKFKACWIKGTGFERFDNQTDDDFKEEDAKEDDEEMDADES